MRRFTRLSHCVIASLLTISILLFFSSTSFADDQVIRAVTGSSGEATADPPAQTEPDAPISVAPDSLEKVGAEKSIQLDSASSMMASADSSTTSTESAPLMLSGANALVQTGAAVYSIPVEVPPGRAGIAPSLVLRYSSYQKNGWLGVGWDLDMGAIQHSTKSGVNYNANDYMLMINGSSTELVERTDWGTNYYGTKIEDSFSQIKFNTATGGFEQTTKDGKKFFFGSSTASRQIDPNNSTRVFKWCLDRVEDTNGNFMAITYEKDQGQIYLKQIDYTGNGTLAPINYIKFYLEDRTDAPPIYDTNFGVTTAKRLKTIEVYGNSTLARKYELQYASSVNTHRSLLASVTQYGNDGVSTLPAIKLKYQEGGSGYVNQVWSGHLAYSYGEYEYWVDLNGDGMTDYVTSDGESNNHYVSLSTGSGYIHQVWVGPGISTTGEHWADLNGDGMTDYVTSDGYGNHYVSLSTGSGHINQVWAGHGISTYGKVWVDMNGDGKADYVTFDGSGNHYVSLSTGSGYINQVWSGHGISTTGEHWADLNGDGMTDYVTSDGTGNHYVSLSTGSGYVNQVWAGHGISTYGKVWVDMNGDGKADYVTTDGAGNHYVSLSTGSGYVNQVWAGHSISTAGAHWADLNGDGMTDYVTSDVYGNHYVSLSTGSGYVNQVWTGYGIDAYGRVWVDMNGDGKADYVTHNWEGTHYVSLSNGLSPDLLCSLTTPLGATATFNYTPSSAWPRSQTYSDHYIPFILQTLSSITVNDGLGNTSTMQYSYSGGWLDFASRELRGFEKVVKTEPNGTIVTTQFHQGDFRKGRQQWVEAKNPGGQLLSRNVFTWDTVPVGNSTFVKLSNKTSELYENGTLAVTTSEALTYDDTNGNLLSKTVSGPDAEDVTTSYQYYNYGTWLWRPTLETITGSVSGKVRETQFDYETGTGNLNWKEHWLDGGANPCISYEYDAYGNLTEVYDANGNPPTITTYDPATHTYPVKVTNQLGQFVESDYDYRYGLPEWQKDVNGNLTFYLYDTFGRLIQTDLPDGGQVSVEYNEAVVDTQGAIINPNTTITRVKENAAGNTIDKYNYVDGLGRAIQVITSGVSAPIVTKAYYDNMGRNYLSKGPFFSSGSFQNQMPEPAQFPWQQTYFDDHGRPYQITRPDGTYGTVSVVMTYNGLTTTITDQDSKKKTEIRDYLGRLIQVIEDPGGLNYITNYGYNAAGNLRQVSGHTGNITTINYDTLGRKINMNDPYMGYWVYTYDANGNLNTQTDAKLQTITFNYDALNRIFTKTYSSGDPTVTYSYDNILIANGIGRLYSVATSNVTTAHGGYDVMGRALSVTKTIVGDQPRTTSYTYDLSGKPLTTTYPDGYVVTNSYYPGTGLLQAATGSDATVFAAYSFYDAAGRIGMVDHANGTNTGYNYDTWSGRLYWIVTEDASENNIQKKGYTYTPAGDVNNIVDEVHSINYTYTYDALHRLVAETNTGGAFPAIFYDYDAIGNITSRSESADTFSSVAQEFTQTITWNADNMPTRIVHSLYGTTDLVYDGAGSRAKKTNGASTTYYIGAHFEITDGIVTKYIFVGNTRVAMIKGGEIYYYHQDHLNSASAMTNFAGQPTESTEYLPYGHVRFNTGIEVSNYNFTDQELDPETGLYNYDARLYDPVIGRFISADSVVPDWTDPQSLNRYAYCRNNPLIYIDPTGHDYANIPFVFDGFSYDPGKRSNSATNIQFTALYLSTGAPRYLGIQIGLPMLYKENPNMIRTNFQYSEIYGSSSIYNLMMGLEPSGYASNNNKILVDPYSFWGDVNKIGSGLKQAGQGLMGALGNQELQRGVEFGFVATVRTTLDVIALTSQDAFLAGLGSKVDMLYGGIQIYNIWNSKATLGKTAINLSTDLEAIKIVIFAK